MKTSAFLLFFSIVFFIYSIINYYIYIRGLQCFPQNSNFRLAFKISFFVIASSYIISRFLERFMINYFTNTLSWIGSFWLGAMTYILLFIILLDLFRLTNSIFSFFPAIITDNAQNAKSIAGIVISAIVSILMIIGYINTVNTRLRKINISINKKVKDSKTLHIVAVSDIHLGTTINKNRATFLVNKINSLNPDIIILAGDILDEVLDPVLKYNIGDILKNLKAPLGVYAITGNHEYIGGIENAAKYITEHNITLLRDTSVLINNCFYLIGREDRDKPRFSGVPRKSLNILMKNIDKSYPIILLDHQPFKLEEACKNGIDLQISGHTHHAQIWPLVYITQKIYELDWGYKKTGDTHYYVSCGFGTWGPPMRIGSRSEIMDFTIKFE